MHKAVVLLLLSALFFLQSSSHNSPVIQFEDISLKYNLKVSHISSPEELYIMESTSGGVGFIDCDDDGRLDIVLAMGSTVDRFRKGGDLMVTLWHQETNSAFKDITRQAGLTRKGWGMGVSTADYDNDGKMDLYVTGYGGNVLYHNLGNCKFEDVTEKSGVRGGGFSTGAAWGDYDRDGNVDLFVPRYVHEDMDALPETHSNGAPCNYLAARVLCGPDGLPGESDFLFHNRGNGTFEEVSRKAGVDDPDHRFGMQGIWGDFQNNGWPDLYVTNDAGPNFYYRNRRDSSFEESGLFSGTALSADGRPQASMGVDASDFAHEGRLGIIVTNFSQEGVDLYLNKGDLNFQEISWPSGLGAPSYPYVGWGTGFVDFDNDGWPELLVANGHAYPQLQNVKDSVPYREPLLLFHNNGNRTFEDVSSLSGLDKFPLHARRGVAFGDVNNDGKMDVLLLNVGEPPTLLLNRTSSSNHAVTFHLLGTKSNRAAIGARVTVKSGDLVQFDEVRGGSSYLSQNDLRLHFGLGAKTKLESVDVSWPSGKKEAYRALPADIIYTLVEGSGIQSTAPYSASASK